VARHNREPNYMSWIKIVVSGSDILTSDFKAEPYWWDRSPRPTLESSRPPEAVDVAVIGSGYTGLCAALQVARGGRSTLVLDAEDAGWGCSTRNGGQISTSIKPDYDALARKHGQETAFNIVKEGHNSLAFMKDFVAEEKIGCDFIVPGRFHAAHNAREYEALARDITSAPKGLEEPAHMVPRAEQRQELGTDVYHGGVVMEAHASLDPGRYHQGILERVLNAGATVIPHCRVEALDQSSDGIDVITAKGKVRARDVIVATNGYTGGLTPWLQRRVIPIGSYIIATEPLDDGVMSQLFPSKKVVSDTRKVVYYYRPSPDHKRIVFGGRVTSGETSPLNSGGMLRSDMIGIFPDLSDVRISHSWMGFVAYTFDELSHIGRREGIHYAMGYCGSGVGMASYLGTRIGQQVLGLEKGRTALDGVGFQTRPLYTGKPWFLPMTVAYYRWRDGTAS
jgi:glycine/D-amino acid oxidase-like deaminating enzyme